jgi:putative pyrroloquinoline-quinone binding quinoprotein
MSVIELGELTDSPGEPTGPGPRATRRLIRQSALTALTVVCLLFVTGAAPPGRPLVHPLWSVPLIADEPMLLTEDAVYLVRSADSRSHLTAYDLATGAARWTWDAVDAAGWLTTAPDAGLVLVRTTRGTVALDAATGAQRWQVPGEVLDQFGDRALIGVYDDRGLPLRVSLVRLSDHQVVWARPTPQVQQLTVAYDAGHPAKVITANNHGEIEIYRYDDGSPQLTATIPWRSPESQYDQSTDMTAMFGMLVVTIARPSHADTAVYRLDTMGLAWRVDKSGGFASDCAPVICLNTATGIAGHDPATGARKWRLTMATDDEPLGHGRLLTGDIGADGPHQLYDTTTGSPVGDEAEGLPVFRGENAGTLVLLHLLEQAPRWSSVSRWNTATGHLDLLGKVEAALRCDATARYLGCRTVAGYQVWEIGR